MMPTSCQALEVYLRDHLAGARAGAKLAHRLASTSKGSVLCDLDEAISADRAELATIAGHLGIREGPVRSFLVGLSESLTRVKFDSWFDRSNSGDLLELETLVLGIEGKRRLWRALLEVDDERLDHEQLRRLEGSAARQAELAEQLRLQAARRVLPAERGTDPPPAERTAAAG